MILRTAVLVKPETGMLLRPDQGPGDHPKWHASSHSDSETGPIEYLRSMEQDHIVQPAPNERLDCTICGAAQGSHTSQPRLSGRVDCPRFHGDSDAYAPWYGSGPAPSWSEPRRLRPARRPFPSGLACIIHELVLTELRLEDEEAKSPSRSESAVANRVSTCRS